TRHSFSFASYYDPKRMGFGALRVLNDDAIAPGAGFGEHPHDNMEIITIPLSGALKHQDNMGNSAVITTGEVQVMSAGTGVAHAEFNASETEPLTLLQIWILTDRRNVVPRYDQRRFDTTHYQNTFFPVVEKMGGEVLGIYQEARLSLGRFEAGKKFEYVPRDLSTGVYFFVIEGEATIADTKLHPRDAVGVWEADTVALSFDQESFVLAIEVPMNVVR
ncbi:MAG: pirin family protein, partial [Candidatus Moranbacteria bacterium]|nr:pirin family protein [Candidatus Moranbacteria bacterium]